MTRKREKWVKAAREPTFNASERLWAVKVLRLTASKMSTGPDDGKIRMICPAIDAAARKIDAQAATDVVVKLQQLIRLRLGGHSTLRSWLAEQGAEGVYSDTPEMYQKVQDTRHQWVADLIKEMSNEQSASGKPVSRKKRGSRKADRAARNEFGFDDDSLFWSSY